MIEGHAQKITISNRVKRYSTKSPKNTIVRSTNPRIVLNREQATKDLKLFVENVKYITYQRGYTITQVFNELNECGVKISRPNFLQFLRVEEIYKFPSILYISTFSVILEVPTWMLFSEQIQKDWQKYADEYL